MSEKGWAERDPKAHSKNPDFGTPLIQVLFTSRVCHLRCEGVGGGWQLFCFSKKEMRKLDIFQVA